MVELIDATEEDRQLLADRMFEVRHGQPAPWVLEAESAGACNVNTILLDGKKVGVFWWWYSPISQTLVLNAGASVETAQRDTYPYFMAAWRKLAAELGATHLSIQTRRAGVIKRWREGGWRVEGVMLRKSLQTNEDAGKADHGKF